jgi:hypothetical protein
VVTSNASIGSSAVVGFLVNIVFCYRSTSFKRTGWLFGKPEKRESSFYGLKNLCMNIGEIVGLVSSQLQVVLPILNACAP